MSQDATAFLQQVTDDPTLSRAAVKAAVVTAETLRGYRPVAVTEWRTVWKTSGLLRGETLDAIAELVAASHIGQRQGGWDQTPGYPIRLHGGVPAGLSH